MKKLKNEQGVSFVFALVAMLVASVVSITILSAAVTTVRRVSDDRTSQQNRLTLTSAAVLVREDMETASLEVTASDDGTDPVTVPTGTFVPFIQTAQADTTTKSATFSIQSTAGEESVTVDTVVEVSDDGGLLFTFTLGDEIVYLTMNQQTSSYSSKRTTGTGVVTTTVTTTKWSTPVITGVSK